MVEALQMGVILSPYGIERILDCNTSDMSFKVSQDRNVQFNLSGCSCCDFVSVIDVYIKLDDFIEFSYIFLIQQISVFPEIRPGSVIAVELRSYEYMMSPQFMNP